MTNEQIREALKHCLQVLDLAAGEGLHYKAGGETFDAGDAVFDLAKAVGANIANEADIPGVIASLVVDRLTASADLCGGEVVAWMTDKERQAVRRIGASQELSDAAVMRQAIRLYEQSHLRIMDGETVSWSGDEQRAKEFAGPLYAKPQQPAAEGVEDILRVRFPYVEQQNVNRAVTVHWFDVVRAVEQAAALSSRSATLEVGGEELVEIPRWLADRLMSWMDEKAAWPPRETLLPIGDINAFRAAIAAMPAPAAIRAEATAQVVAEERERCAAIADHEMVEIFDDSPEEDAICNAVVREIAKNIRAGEGGY